MYPQGHTTLDSKGKALKWSRCPLPSHQDAKGFGTRTSDFLGEQQDFEGNPATWTFRCKHGGRPFHTFYALPDPDTPRRPEDFAPWAERQRAEQERKKEEKHKYA